MCLHGGGPGASAASNYSRNANVLAEHFRVLLVDLPGYGESDKPKIGEPISVYNARAIHAMLDELGIKKAHFLGNSLGGWTALRFAIEHPNRADRLVLMGPGGGLPIFTPMPTEGLRALLTFYEGPPTRERFEAFMKSMIFDPGALTPELMDERFAAATKPGVAENFPLRLRNMQPMDPTWQSLSEIVNRTLVIWGRDDRTVTLDSAFIMLNQMPDVRLHVFSRCGHWAQWEKADEFNRLVMDFLSAP